MAVGLAVAALLLVAWPAYLFSETRSMLPLGGERELSLVTAAATVLLAFLIISPGVFLALDTTSMAALSRIVQLRSSLELFGVSDALQPFDALRAAPFLLGARELNAEIWIVDLLIAVFTLAVFAAAARIGGLSSGVFAVFLVLSDAEIRTYLGTFNPEPLALTGFAVAITAMIVGNRVSRLRRISWCLSLFLLFTSLWYAAGSGALDHGIAVASGRASLLPALAIAVLGGSAARWWSKGLREQPLEWTAYRAGMASIVGVVVIGAAAAAVSGKYPAAIHMTLHAAAAIVAGGVVGGFSRLLRWHPLAAPAIVVAAVLLRVTFFPPEERRRGGIASTIDDLRAVAPPDADLYVSIDPLVASELLKRPVLPLRELSGSAGARRPLILETRFSSAAELERIRKELRIVPLLPGIFRVAQLQEASAPPVASQ